LRPHEPKRLSQPELLQYAVRALQSRSLSVAELRTKLHAQAQCPGYVDQVMARLKQYGYVDDRRFAENFSRLRRENQGFGKYRVARDLRGRRVPPHLAEKAVKEAYLGTDEAALIQRFLRHKLRYIDQPPKLQDRREIASLYRMLMRAGFTSAKILDALRRMAAQPEWLEGLESEAEPPPAEVSD